MKNMFDGIVDSLKEGLPAWTIRLRELKSPLTQLTDLVTDMIVDLRKNAQKLDDLERESITKWVGKLKKAGLKSADASFLVVHLEQARGARNDAFAQGLMKVASDMVLPLLGGNPTAEQIGTIDFSALDELLKGQMPEEPEEGEGEDEEVSEGEDNG